MSYTQREQRLAISTGVVIGLAVIYLTGIKPTMERYKALTAQRESVSTDVAQLEQRIRKNKTFRAQWKEQKKQLATADPDAFFKRLERQIAKQGLVLKSHSKGHGEKLKGVDARRIPYQLNLEGSFGAVTRLLVELRNSPDFLRAENLTLTPRKDGSFQVNASISTLVSEQKGAK